jgi:hypothetical protein
MTMETGMPMMSPADAAPPPDPQTVARAPQRLGFWLALGWTGTALAAQIIVGVIVVVALRRAAANEFWLQIALYLSGLAAQLAVIVPACRCSGWRAIDYLALRWPRGAFLRPAALAFVFTVAMSLAANFLFPNQVVVTTTATTTAQSVTLVAIGAIVFAPIGEEILFRGFMFRALADSRVGVAGAILLTALAWAALHFDKSWAGLVGTFVSGLVWGWLRWRTQSTLMTIAVHVLYNVVASTFLLVQFWKFL